MNHVILIGTLKSKEDVQTKKKITLSVKRTYKNEKGFFETDDITCLLWSGIISKVDNYFNEVNTGKGLKLKRWMLPYFRYVLPVLIIIVFIQGLIG